MIRQQLLHDSAPLDNMTNFLDQHVGRQSVELKHTASLPSLLAQPARNQQTANHHPHKRRPKRRPKPPHRAAPDCSVGAVMPAATGQFAAIADPEFDQTSLDLDPGCPVYDVRRYEQQLGAAQPQHFWSAEQRRILDAQLVPPDNFYQHARRFQGATPCGPLPAPELPPFEQCCNNVPLPYSEPRLRLYCEAYSQAEAEFNGFDGVHSSDQMLLEDTDEALRYLQTYNTRPLLFVEVHGFHAEPTVATQLSTEGGEATKTVTDFDFKIDISQYIYPFGYIQCTAQEVPVLDTITSFQASSRHCSKVIRMNKIIYFEFEKLRRKVYKYMRGELHWSHGLTVGFPRMYHTVTMGSLSCNSYLRESCWWACFSSLLQQCSGAPEEESELQSLWKIEYSADQVFHEHVKHQLWVPETCQVSNVFDHVDSYGNTPIW